MAEPRRGQRDQAGIPLQRRDARPTQVVEIDPVALPPAPRVAASASARSSRRRPGALGREIARSSAPPCGRETPAPPAAGRRAPPPPPPGNRGAARPPRHARAGRRARANGRCGSPSASQRRAAARQPLPHLRRRPAGEGDGEAGSGATSRTATRWAMRWVSVRVLPEPGRRRSAAALARPGRRAGRGRARRGVGGEGRDCISRSRERRGRDGGGPALGPCPSLTRVDAILPSGGRPRCASSPCAPPDRRHRTAGHRAARFNSLSSNKRITPYSPS